jgi:hypothetical protein
MLSLGIFVRLFLLSAAKSYYKGFHQQCSAKRLAKKITQVALRCLDVPQLTFPENPDLPAEGVQCRACSLIPFPVSR